MKYFPHLKIEFRAVPYSSKHVLEYRISPDQYLTYYVEKSIFGFKFQLKRKFKTNWHQPSVLINYPSAYLYSKESGDPYLPIFIKNKKDLEWYKEKFKTIGEFFKYIEENEAKEEAEWKKLRDEYLENNKIWE